MPRSVIDAKSGRTFKESDPDFDKVRINNLESQVHELVTAVVDLQNRVARLDGEDVQWPGDTYEPTHTAPYAG